jgi:RNA polymerase sigma factor (TIGR02999 family)
MAHSDPPSVDVTRLLALVQGGDDGAREQLAAEVYSRLRALAHRQLDAGSGNSMAATDLVHEAYFKLVDQATPWENRAHFFGVAAKAMRSILVDHARARRALKRGGDLERSPLEDAVASFESRAMNLITLDEALKELAAFDERKALLVDLRFFGGLSMDEAARVLGVSLATAEREWSVTRAWLRGRV